MDAGALKQKARDNHDAGILCIERGDKPRAEINLKKSLKCFEELFTLQHINDGFEMADVDTYTKTYKWLSQVLIDSGREPEALQVIDRGQSKEPTDKFHLPKQREDCVSLAASRGSSFAFDQLKMKYPKKTSRDSVPTSIGDLTDKNTGGIVNPDIKAMNQYPCEDRSTGRKDVDEHSENSKAKESQTNSRDGSKPVLLCSAARNVLPEDGDSNKDNTLDNLLKLFYKMLLNPVEDKITKPELVIVPEGPLFALPFPALMNSQGEYLLDVKRIRLASSLNTSRILQEKSDEKHFKHGALIVGNPLTKEVEFKEEKNKTFEDLPGAEKEARLIGKVLDKEPFIGKAATKAEVMQWIREGVAVIHIAAHGDGETGSVILSPGPCDGTPKEEDYILTIPDVYSCKINAQLVVLSCCHSGRGSVSAEGVVGMSRAFLAAGARSVIASLWAIGDAATRDFMKRFYGHLKKSEMSTCASLQETMKEMKEKYQHPYYWAAFFLIGDDIKLHSKFLE